MKRYRGNFKKSIFVLILLIIVLIPAVQYYSFVNSPASSKNKSVQIKVTKGMSSSLIINKLFENKLIKSKLLAKFYMKLSGTGNNLKAGVYKFNVNMTPKTIFGMLKNREIDPDFVSFTVPEGYTVKQIAVKLYNLGVVKSTEDFYISIQNDAFDYEFIKNIPANRTYRLEGYLFPATYEFEKGMPVHTIVDSMLKRFNVEYTRLKEEANNISVDRAIIIASMVEGEARLDSERPLVAAVIFNRLRINMKLQIDATVQYALGTHKSTVYLKDLRVDSPYNTYKYAGLPIGPICNPGEKSIEAVLNPVKANYIYYVAKGDGGHFFTDSYKKFLSVKKSMKK